MQFSPVAGVFFIVALEWSTRQAVAAAFHAARWCLMGCLMSMCCLMC